MVATRFLLVCVAVLTTAQVYGQTLKVVHGAGIPGTAVRAGEGAQKHAGVHGLPAFTLRNFDPVLNPVTWFVQLDDPSQGFVHGTNEFEDQAKATRLSLPPGIPEATLTDITIFFGLVDPVAGQTYDIEIYDVGTGGAPGTLLGSQTFNAADAVGDTDFTVVDPTFHSFDEPVTVPEAFFVAVNFGTYSVFEYGSLGIAATDRQGRRVEEEWELDANGVWASISDNWFDNGDDGWYMWIEATVEARVEGDGLTRSIQASGSEADAYRLISVPLALDNTSPAAVLEDDLGEYDEAEWRFFSLSSSQDYAEFPNAAAMEAGRGFWLVVSEGGQSWDTGPGSFLPADQPFFIDLNAGWTFIGTPFNVDVPNADLQLTGAAIRPDIRSYSGSGWATHSGPLRPFEGYAVASNEADQLFIPPCCLTEAARKAEPPPETAKEESWSIRIQAQARSARDEDNVALVAASASRSWDALDLPEPPVIGTYVSVYFPHPDWQTPFDAYSTDARPIPQERETWTFEVKSNVQDKVTLRFTELETVPESFEVWLIDEVTRGRQNLRRDAVYAFAGTGEQKPRRFQVLVGRPEALTEALGGDRPMPLDVVLENFPNPFAGATTLHYGLPEDAQVTVTVYNVLGEKVVTLVDQLEQPAGRHVLVWDGRAQGGEAVAGGVYVCRLRAGNVVRSKTLVMLR